MENHQAPPTTEALQDHTVFDRLAPSRAVEIFLNGQKTSIEAVYRASDEIIAAGYLVAEVIASGGVLVYAAAGSSGLMALADGSELSGTFGIPQKQIRIHMAGGVPADGHMPGHTEDDVQWAQEALDGLTSKDVLIVLSASGSTPYALAVANGARQAGAKVIAIANNAGAPLFEAADVKIFLETPPEVIGGSTRLAAGTAQKATLNLMSSLAGVKLGHVYQGMMVNLTADNAKLQVRAIQMVARIAGVDTVEAERALAEANGAVKPAVLIAAGCDKATSEALLQKHKGALDSCLETLTHAQNDHSKGEIT